MEKYRLVIKKRIRLYQIVLCLIVIVFNLFNFFNVFQSLSANPHYTDFVVGIQLGSVSSLVIILGFTIAKYHKALKNEKQLQLLYNQEHDERKMYIKEKSGISVLLFCSVTILLAGVITGYFNTLMMITFLFASFFLLFVGVILKFYYLRKY